MKRHLILACVTLLMLSACQKQEGTPPAQGGAPASGPPPVAGDISKNPDMTELAKEVDADGNGQLSRAEWQAKGLPESTFNMFEKGRGYVTLKDYQENAAPPGIDLNGDGKLTIAEFRAFDAKMGAQKKDGKGPPPPAGAR